MPAAPVHRRRARSAPRPHRADHGGPPRGDLQCTEAHDIGVASGNRGRGSRREGARRRRRVCPLVDRAPGLPEDLRNEFDPVTNEERTSSDRPAELVTRDRDQVGILDMGGKVDPQRLDGIGVKPRAGSVTSGDLDERRDVVHHPRLVVDGHDRHDRDELAGGVENRGEPVGGDGAVGLEFDCEALRAPPVRARRMFTGRADGDLTLREGGREWRGCRPRCPRT